MFVTAKINGRRKMSDLISRGKLFNLLAPVQTLGEAYGIIQEMPTVDAVPVVRCKDCEWWTKQDKSLQGRCARYGTYPTGEWFCAAGRKDGKVNGNETD